MPASSTLPLDDAHERDVVSIGGVGYPGSGEFRPLTWAPVTVHFGVVSGFGGAGQMSMTLPLTVPPAEPLCSKMLPFDQMSPTTVVVELPWKMRELPPLGQP